MKFRCIVLLVGWLMLVLGVGQSAMAMSSKNDVQKKIKVACVGNSVTRGYLLSNPERDSYPSQLQNLLGDAYEVQNFGHSGATLLSKGHRPYVEMPEYPEALKFDADIIVIHLGLNDTDPRNWPSYRDEFVPDYMALIDSFRTHSSNKPQVYICKMTPIFNTHPRFKSGTRDWFWQIQDAIEQVAKNSKTGLIDLHPALYGRPGLFPDAIHPNEEGAGILAQTVYENITGDFGGLSLAPVFMNHMVLQQKKPIPVYGKANSGTKLTLTFAKQKRTCTANEHGEWSVTFDAVAAGGPYELKVSSDSNESILLEDILVGEVWLCAGQSNMDFETKHAVNASTLIDNAADFSNLRLYKLKGLARTDNKNWDLTTLVKVNQLDFFDGEWEPSSSDDAAEFSAIGYTFGRQLNEKLNVPIGLIQLSVGGAPAEAFIDRKTLEFDPYMVDVLNNWKQNDFIQGWCRERAATNTELAKNKLQRHPYEPAYIYEAGMSLVQGIPVAGVIWYQGESNAHNAEHFRHAFSALVKSWRSAFNNAEMPFYFAQLSSIDRPSWPYFRETQRELALSIPKAAMVVTSDLGDSLDVHPKHKIEIGERFANLALSRNYGMQDVPDGGPQISTVTQEKDKVILTFSHAAQLKTSDGEVLRELEVAGEDGLFYPVAATLKDNKIIIKSKDKKIEQVRYGWKPFSRANLVNENGWPASTFRVACPL
ncbi:GDSL-type esterase/lipase family protein [Maribellus sp. YY47]|uniref:GDSL-type esterase/lipase family protein n=1 Tax=Maribellus sp. YY47 TaxID=2929486 RepID=UPI0020013C61|nr:GDSL-type esterase/lipase family protein [Maribellus sp. YY47]MCK3683211.1 GDSL-type esterase/lipase family protein [Maribellus sp. YY47]